jgi:hypothetical protein
VGSVGATYLTGCLNIPAFCGVFVVLEDDPPPPPHPAITKDNNNKSFFMGYP